jgi:hypothetical protein
LLQSTEADPDPHYFGKLDPDPHLSESWIRIRIRIKVKIQNFYRLKVEPWTLTNGALEA